MATETYRSSGKFEELRRDLLERGELYEDTEFVPSYRLLCTHDHSNPRNKFTCNNDFVVWKRPTEICENAKFTVGGTSRYDLDQGVSGDCWFVAAAATIAMNSQLLGKVVPSGQSFKSEKYAGIFCFNFWHFGKWTEIVIDDRLPYEVNIFAERGLSLRNCQNREEELEFWPALLEKAYAKLYGGYHKLEGGKIQDALVDMTGGCGLTLNTNQVQSNQLFDWIIYPHTVLGCSIKETTQSKGLKPKHAYSITGCLKTNSNGKPIDLIRLRDPKSYTNWNGNWSSGSSEWNSITREHFQKCDPDYIKEHGEFWISFDDWQSIFDEVAVCHVAAEEDPRHWQKVQIKDRWMDSDAYKVPLPDGNQYGPQYEMEVKRPRQAMLGGEEQCHVMVSVMRIEPNTNVIHRKHISVNVYDIQESGSSSNQRLSFSGRIPIVDTAETKYREVTAHFLCKPGMYCVEPKAYQPESGAKFLLRMVADGHLYSREIK